MLTDGGAHDYQRQGVAHLNDDRSSPHDVRKEIMQDDDEHLDPYPHPVVYRRGKKLMLSLIMININYRIV